MMASGSETHTDVLDESRQRGAEHEDIDRILIPVGTEDGGIVYNRALGEVPAMLVAGTTGSGKSSFVKTLIAEMMQDRTPNELRLVIADSSRVEYACCAASPFLAMPIVCDNQQVEALVRFIASESERRMKILSHHAESNYPHLFVILDDFVALEPSGEALTAIEHIIQTARLTRLHVILVTSLPSSRLLTGGILSNVDCRVSFRVTSRADSLRVTNQAGANKLGTPGEMLYCSGGSCICCAASYLNDAEVKKLCDKAGHGYEYGSDFFIHDLFGQKEKHAASDHDMMDDSLISRAAQIIVETQFASTSVLQRKLKVGYARAGRILDELERRGIVGPSHGSRPREVLIDSL